ncbi:hypothetical protein BDW02DRAFT_572575 [Decorospora gaudefroyi]|uniref:Mitotic checkpoint regulator, MAD2B-interacting-domain-containing protein n=1 Tax=Decorospora gaudefroyi TaxID=184978 RepID=A0A6A5K8E0_9PLEO|nr:hypothetical protein BDW02DRAFT_572575 [Decorospora gaudefroyi]
MNLAGYSDSESDNEAPPAPKAAAKPAPKPAFHKVVDRANPGRIKVHLPGAARPETDDVQDDAPPAKKARLGGRDSAFAGFNAMLPAPKKPNVRAAAATESANPGSRGLGKALASGLNLKTGAEPAFKRESRMEADAYDDNGNPIHKEPMKKEEFRAMLNLPPPKTEAKAATTAEIPVGGLDAVPEPHQVPKPVVSRFVPMSVGKGKKKKKPLAPHSAAVATGETAASSTQMSTSQPPPPMGTKPRKPNVSLFGVSSEAEPAFTRPSDGQYQPLLYGTEEEEESKEVAGSDDALGLQSTGQAAQYAPTSTGASAPDDLTNIASELNLSEAERRQLFGKNGRGAPDFSAAKIVEFNTDTEYAHNEKLRQQGEQVQHNPLKSISGTGKNSLRSLVNVATTQKDALEEHFASGHRNKKEAGNRYGW